MNFIQNFLKSLFRLEQLKQYHPAKKKVHHNNIENLNLHHTYSQLSSISLMNKLNKIGDRGHPCLTLRLIEKILLRDYH